MLHNNSVFYYYELCYRGKNIIIFHRELQKTKYIIIILYKLSNNFYAFPFDIVKIYDCIL